MQGLFFEGLFLQASLIFALGAQNIFVLESGMRKQYPLLVSFVCFVCDLSLIMLGVAGAATMLKEYPQLKILVGLVGVFFLFTYGLNKVFPRGSQGMQARVSENLDSQGNLKRTILLSMTFSILNPHAYLDAFILIGGYSTKYALMEERVILGLGAAVFSGIWFLILTGASSMMRPLLFHPSHMRKIMSSSGLLLMFLSMKLGWEVAHWIAEELGPTLPLMSLSYPLAPGSYFTTILY